MQLIAINLFKCRGLDRPLISFIRYIQLINLGAVNLMENVLTKDLFI